MITSRQSQERAYQKYAWVILFGLGVLLVANILIVVAFTSGTSDFEADTGVAWDEFTAAYPSVASAYILKQRLLYVGFASIGLFALVMTYFGLRPGHRWAWFALWVLPAALALTTILMILGRRPRDRCFLRGFLDCSGDRVAAAHSKILSEAIRRAPWAQD